VRHHGAQDHGGRENDEDGAVSFRLCLARAGAAELVVGREDLDEDGAEFPRGRGNAMTRGAVASREDLTWDDVRCCVGTCE